jgi:hypothetical protein
LGPLPGAPSIPEKMILVDMVKINVYCRNGKELYCFHPFCNLLIYHFLKLTLQNLLSIQYCNGQVIFSIQWPLNLRFLICAVPISILRLSMLLLLHTILLLLTCSDISHIKSSWKKVWFDDVPSTSAIQVKVFTIPLSDPSSGASPVWFANPHGETSISSNWYGLSA